MQRIDYHFLEEVLGKKCGGSTGTNLYGTLLLVVEMLRRDEQGSHVTLICDAGELYLDTYYNSTWLAHHGYDMTPYLRQLHRFYETAEWLDA
jgi:cysteine synthase